MIADVWLPTHSFHQRECDRLRNTCAGNPRDQAIIELLLQTGIKLSELVHLRLDDIELGEKQKGVMRIQTRRGKQERLVPLNSKATAALSTYLGDRKAEESMSFLVNRFGETL